ncbi:hypothetical protein B6E66_07245 [Streptomyces maremycinicus]|nr:hypothetical protein B6E66_07245 [Streptomyces sp. B9173]
MHMNPGTEPLPMGTEETAEANMAVFVKDLDCEAAEVTSYERTPAADYGDGRYAFTLRVADDRAAFEIQMPGISLDRLRGEGDNPFACHRLYVDGNSWLWGEALGIVGEIW